MEDIVKITREELINKLIADDMRSILHGGESGEIYLCDILMHGHTGYNNWTDEQLQNDAYDRLDVDYEITKKC